MPSVPPNVTITWIDLQTRFANLTWQLFEGYVTVLQLRHANFTYNPLIGSAASASNIDISTWDVIRDDIGPEESNVVVYPKGVTFNLELYNLFSIVPFEDTHLHDGGQFTGRVSQLVVEPVVHRTRQFKYNITNITSHFTF